MAPEILRMQKYHTKCRCVDPKVDLWSAGTILYQVWRMFGIISVEFPPPNCLSRTVSEMVTGRPPFKEETSSLVEIKK